MGGFLFGVALNIGRNSRLALLCQCCILRFMQVRIFCQSRSATQSGRAKVGEWVIQPLLPTARRPESVMGWTSSADTLSEVKMTFKTYEEAAAFAGKQNWKISVEPVQNRIVRPRNYADNFKAWLKEEA